MDMTDLDTFFLICLIAGPVLLVLAHCAGLGRAPRASPAAAQAAAYATAGTRLGRFCRGCLLIGIGLWLLLFVGLAIAALAYMPLLLLLFVVPVLYYGKGRYFGGSGWAFGTARWSSLRDLLRAGMLRDSGGLLVGKTAPPTVAEAAGILKDASPAEAETAAWLFRSALKKEAPWVRLSRGNHAVAFSPTGGGKGQGIVLTNASTHPGATVFIDNKGENAMLTAEYRRRVFGHQVVILDPFRQVTQTPDTLKPLDFINPASPTALDDARAITEALVIRTGEEKEPHWLDSAKLWIWAMIALTLHKAPPERRNLQTVCTLLSNTAEMQTAIKVMQKSDAWGGMLARLGYQLSHFVERELGSTLTTVGRQLRFLSTLAVSESTSSSSFDPAKLRDGKITIYLVLPTEYLRTQSALLRLWISSLFRACLRGGLDERKKVLFILDEAAALGHMDCIDDAIDKYRGYGVRLLFMFQSMGQLQQCFPTAVIRPF